jgi:hypothetical protein
MKLVLDRAQLVTLVRTGIANGVWEYQDTTLEGDGWATADRPIGAVRIGEDTFVHPIGSAPDAAPIACPLCGQVHVGACSSTVPGKESGGGVSPPSTVSTFKGSGSASTAVASAAQAATDADVTELSRVEVSIHEIGRDLNQQLARLHSLMPAGQPGVEVVYSVDLAASIGRPEHVARIEFTGPAADFSPLKSACDHLLRRGEATFSASLDATFQPPIDLAGETWAAFTQRAADTGPARCDVRLFRAGHT